MHHPISCRALLGALVLALPQISVVRAEAPLVGQLGGPADFGTHCMSPNDDGSSDPIDLTPVFPTGIHFYGTDAAHTHRRMFVNTNGNITFGEPLAEYSPNAFPVAARPMIAPYWADVDIRRIKDDAASGNARCIEASYTGAPGNGSCLSPTSNGVWWSLDEANDRVVVTWDDVNYFACNDDAQMAFQLILSRPSECASDGDFDVEFRYATCEWNTGDASGGSRGFPGRRLCTGSETPSDGCAMPAQAGFDAGDTEHFTELADSRTNAIHTTLCRGSNVGMPGVYRFQIRAGRVICPGSGGDCVVPNALGACAVGSLSCVGAGTECAPLASRTQETCDGIDNDCDGVADDGDPGCPAGSFCSRGRCLPYCLEDTCGEGRICAQDGSCVDSACFGVTCDEGELCVDGTCQDACAGVVCPDSQTCRAGRCVDACDTVRCDPACAVCSRGACVARCDADADCDAGERCADDGRCVDTLCVGVTCGNGGRCEAGACVDACEGVVCPAGQSCTAGRCLAPGEPSPDQPSRPGATNGDDDSPGRAVNGGCSCSVDSRVDPSLASVVAFLLLVAFLVSRRKRGN